MNPDPDFIPSARRGCLFVSIIGLASFALGVLSATGAFYLGGSL